ncbi:hypothetical protein BJY04DRAFT_215415 [Aspergillus karnatakaensis]|uniref:uncharacterized protein n=1 Tax=Aspergillus karnatakaensis TaxID=1810916 RepID=UPI003CCE3843
MTSTSSQLTATPETDPMPPALPRAFLQTLFTSLTRTSKSRASSTPPQSRWTLLRTLKSENPNDITGDLHGTATFTPLRKRTPSNLEQNSNDDEHTELLYSEEGSLPASFGPGLRWTKKYIWRLSPDGKISVWFVKVDKRYEEGEEEADYLFHEFDFSTAVSSLSTASASAGEEFVSPPTPPDTGIGSLFKTDTGSGSGTVVAARGNHLCINDMYRTAYAFRVQEGSGEVLSWSSRHVVKGPKKGQDIVNLYSRAS